MSIKYKNALKKLGAALAVVILTCAPTVLAQSHNSTNYQVNEAVFGAGGEIDANSASYNARGTAGALGVGDASSTNYNASAGSVTPREEYLEFNIANATVDLGNLTTTTTGTGSAIFYVRTYVASGYVVKTMSNPPTSEGGAMINAKTSQGASAQGTEEFGMNMVANTAPATMGADPAPQPNSGFAFGIAASGYNTADQYKYNVGDTVASAPKGIGQTNYTISYIANIGPITEAGSYSMVHDLVVIPTF